MKYDMISIFDIGSDNKRVMRYQSGYSFFQGVVTSLTTPIIFSIKAINNLLNIIIHLTKAAAYCFLSQYDKGNVSFERAQYNVKEIPMNTANILLTCIRNLAQVIIRLIETVSRELIHPKNDFRDDKEANFLYRPAISYGL